MPPGVTIIEQGNPLVITVVVPGPPGPPNVLSIGTVTNGGSASATITGIFPDQELNLVLPEGPTGPSGDGMPADSTSLTGAVDLNVSAFTPSKTRFLTLTGNVVLSNNPPNPDAGIAATTTLILQQAASGGPYTVTWPAGLEWAENAAPPIMPTAASAELEVHLFHNGVAWRGKVGGVYYP